MYTEPLHWQTAVRRGGAARHASAPPQRQGVSSLGRRIGREKKEEKGGSIPKRGREVGRKKNRKDEMNYKRE